MKQMTFFTEDIAKEISENKIYLCRIHYSTGRTQQEHSKTIARAIIAETGGQIVEFQGSTDARLTGMSLYFAETPEEAIMHPKVCIIHDCQTLSLEAHERFHLHYRYEPIPNTIFILNTDSIEKIPLQTLATSYRIQIGH